jgi:hypothetical protein
VPICRLQGKYFSSPYLGQVHRTQGVVYARSAGSSHRGVFLQADGCDSDPYTSDGLFVYLGDAPGPAPGDLVEVTGIVQEYYGRTELTLVPGRSMVLSAGNALPQPVELVPPQDNALAERYFEAREGMHAGLQEAEVLGPADEAGETWIRPAGPGEPRLFFGDPAGTGQVFALEASGQYRLEVEPKVGDRLFGLAGALDESGGAYRLQLLSQPSFTAGSLPPPGSPPEPPGFTAATVNLANLFDASDDPQRGDMVLSPAEYQRRLEKRARLIGRRLGGPDLLAVQEVENSAVLQAFLARPEIGAGYGYVLEDGPDPRGLDVALLYKVGRVRVLWSASRQGCTALVDGLGPDGNGEVHNPQNALTCDRDGDGNFDGNRLFSRPPLVVHLALIDPERPEEGETELWVIVNHWKARTEDTSQVEYTAPRRLEQARFVAALVQELPPGANLLVLGDLNAVPGSEPLKVLAETGLRDLWSRLPPAGRYSYIYRGLSQALDYILIRPSLPLFVTAVQACHVNADYPAVYAGVEDTDYRSSDHDPLLVQFRRPDYLFYLPAAWSASSH